MKRFLLAAVLGLALASPALAQEGGQAVQPPAEAAAPAETPAIVEAPAPAPADPAAPVWTGPEVTQALKQAVAAMDGVALSGYSRLTATQTLSDFVDSDG